MDFGLDLTAADLQAALSAFWSISIVTAVTLAVVAVRLAPQIVSAIKRIAGRR